MTPPAAGGLRGLVLRAGTALGSVALTLLLLEGALRLFFPIPLHATDTFLTAGTNAAQAGLMALRPNTSVRSKTDEFDVAVRINSRGLRGREMGPEKPPGGYRVLVLGDSQTFGWGVEDAECYPRVIEQGLRRQSRRPVEVINAGVPGTGTAQQLYFLETEGWSYRPDAVVVGFFINDLGDNGLSRLYAVTGGRLRPLAHPAREARPLRQVVDWDLPGGDFREVRAAEAPPVAPPSFLARHSHVFRLLRERAAALKHRQQAEIPFQRPSYARELTGRLLAEVARQCADRQVRCLVALIPSRAQCRDAGVTSLTAEYAPVLRLLPRDAAVTDLLPAFRKAGGADLYFPKDQHLTAAGHRLAGQTLADRLAGMEPSLR